LSSQLLLTARLVDREILLDFMPIGAIDFLIFLIFVGKGRADVRSRPPVQIAEVCQQLRPESGIQAFISASDH